jgi:hypothetical protein
MNAMKKLFSVVAVLAMGTAPGHAADAAKGAPLPDIKPGMAQVVVMRSTTVNALVSSLLYDTTSGEPKVLGKISNNRKVIVDLPPGDHILMVGPNGLFEFMPVSVVEGKRYFAVVAPVWPANYFLRPVRHSNNGFLYGTPEFDRLLKKTKIADPYTETMDEKDKAKLMELYKLRWEKWSTKTDAEKLEVSIRPEDAK